MLGLVVSVLTVVLLLYLWVFRDDTYRRLNCASTRPTDRRKRVAVIGGGIAGSGAAWTLAESGFDVTLFEAKDRVGGNANTHSFGLKDGREVRCGLSVLAWPEKLFQHYEALLTRLNVERESVRLPFLVEDSKGTFCLNHAADLNAEMIAPEFQTDMQKWNRMIWVIRTVTKLFAGRSGSLYAFSFLNPFNLIPLRFFARFFVSNAFWEKIAVPIYSTTFLTSNLNRIPCVIAPTMNDIIPLDKCPNLNTWSEGSSIVFERLLERVNVELNASVISVIQNLNCISIKCAKSDDSMSFDRVIFACDAHSARAMYQPYKSAFWLDQILKRVLYVDDLEGSDFLDGVIHRSPAVALSAKAKPFLSRVSNYVQVEENGNVSNTFVLSSWIPKVRSMNIDFSVDQPFLVSYGRSVLQQIGRNFSAPVKFRFAHPFLCVQNLLCAFLMRFVHSPKSGVVFCGSWTTPGNGHDLSLCSGIAAAHSLGAQYPFHNDKELCSEFVRARRVIGL